MDQFSFKTLNYLLVLGLLFLPSLCYVSAGYVQSRATYYSTPDGKGTPTGACGYGGYGRDVYDGKATGVSNLWHDGLGCGACYQVRCTNPALCNKNGTTVVVTDYGQGDRTDFVMSRAGYAGMALRGREKQLFNLGTVDVVFNRVPCSYPGHNIFYKVHENSRYPNYLSIVLLYVGGKSDILAIELEADRRSGWSRMRHVNGAVYEMANPPRGPISFRFLVRGSNGATSWVYPKGVIPSYWRAGATYDSKIQLK